MKMNFAAYIQAQKMRVRAGHERDIDLICADGQARTLFGHVAPLRDSAEIFCEIDGLRGLNTAERMAAARIPRAAERDFSAA